MMKQQILTLCEKLLELLPVILLGGFGGFTRTISGKNQESAYSFRIALPEILIAIFCGLLIHWILLEYNISDNIRTAAIALAGYCARTVLEFLQGFVLAKIKHLIRKGKE